MKSFQEFKEFAVKGSMIDIAIGIIMGTAFNKVIDVLVKEVIMPPFLMLFGRIQLEDIKLVLQQPEFDATGAVVKEEVAVSFGLLIETLISFLILALAMFAVIKVMNKMKRQTEDGKDKAVKQPKDIELMTKMTDLLQEQNELIKARA